MQLQVKSNPSVAHVFSKYPKEVRHQMQELRALVLEAAKECSEVKEIEETLKWGEPSYLTKKGSTIRMDWKEKTPKQYAIYFKCTSKLVATFKAVFGDLFNYETTRAIVFKLDQEIPKSELKACITKALTYHQVKKLDLLGF